MLSDKKDSEFYQNLHNSSSTREFIVERSHSSNFEWRDSAISLLEWLFKDDGIINKFNRKNF
jgi:hypothetical protein